MWTVRAWEGASMVSKKWDKREKVLKCSGLEQVM
jgi:hypothetical protein